MYPSKSHPTAMVTEELRSHGMGWVGAGAVTNGYLTSHCLIFPSGLGRCVEMLRQHFYGRLIWIYVT